MLSRDWRLRSVPFRPVGQRFHPCHHPDCQFAAAFGANAFQFLGLRRWAGETALGMTVVMVPALLRIVFYSIRELLGILILNSSIHPIIRKLVSLGQFKYVALACDPMQAGGIR